MTKNKELFDSIKINDPDGIIEPCMEEWAKFWNLDEEEKEILESLDRGELVSDPNSEILKNFKKVRDSVIEGSDGTKDLIDDGKK